ncbi:MAG: hypothetical protein SFU98_08870 [Leptospiraceae bacterium]|nr:hypothetical protein [Leptospiraceae bacterium]
MKPALEESLEESIFQKDKKFLISASGKMEYSFVSNPQDELKKIDKKSLNTIAEKNRYAILLVKNLELDDAEETWIKILETENRVEVFYNLLRLYFLKEEYTKAKELSKKFILKNRSDKKKLLSIGNSLKEETRFEEATIYYDTLSEESGLELESLEEVARYFYSIGDNKNALLYYERILEIFSFHAEALSRLVILNTKDEKYENAILYFQALKKISPKPTEFYPFLFRAYYETGEYDLCLSLLNEIPEKVKREMDIIEVYLVTEPNFPFEKIQTKSKVENFYSSPEGKKLYKDIFSGY